MINDFNNMGADEIVEVVVKKIMKNVDDDRNGALFWKGKLISLIQNIVEALVFLRDKDGGEINLNVIKEYLNLEKLIALSKKEGLPERITTGLKKYLKSFPSYVEDISNQDERMLEQHGYIQMIASRQIDGT